MKSLLASSKSLPASARPLVRPGDEIIVVDLHVHSGDHALGSIMAAADLGHIIRHIMIKMTKDKWSVQSLEWTQKRVGAYLCNKWLKHELKLLSTTGQVVPPIESEVTVPLLDQIYSFFFLFFFYVLWSSASDFWLLTG